MSEVALQDFLAAVSSSDHPVGPGSPYRAWILHKCRRSYLDVALKISGLNSKRYSGVALSNPAAVRLISSASRHS